VSAIEWISENVYEPCTEDLDVFCHRRSIAVPRSPISHPLVFVSGVALRQVKEHLKADVSREHGGILVGTPYRDAATGQEFVDVHAAIPAPRTVGTGIYLQFTAGAWEHVSTRIDGEFPGRLVVGWSYSCQKPTKPPSAHSTTVVGAWRWSSIPSTTPKGGFSAPGVSGLSRPCMKRSRKLVHLPRRLETSHSRRSAGPGASSSCRLSFSFCLPPLAYAAGSGYDGAAGFCPVVALTALR
jgi:hypothetical protein